MNSLLAITYAFMLSYCPYHEMAVGEMYERYDNPTHTSFQIGLELFDYVNLFAGEETYQKMKDSVYRWKPYSQSYWVGAEYYQEFGEEMKLTVGYKHLCQHPVESWGKQSSNYNFAYSQLHIGIEGKLNVFGR